MKIFLDDVRNPPDGTWVCTRWVGQTFRRIMFSKVPVDVLSLDHDLACFDKDGKELTGYTLLCMLESALYSGQWHPQSLPEFRIHSANPEGRRKMELAIGAIQRFWEER